MPSPRLLADEMLGRLTRQLRMIGCDTRYAHGWTDDEIVACARSEHRVLLTRDRALARRTPGSVLLTRTSLPDQIREVRRAIPDLTLEVSFDRCTLCNGRLEPELADAVPPEPAGGAEAPRDRPIYRCVECGHRYGEGSHTADVRRRLNDWAREATA